MMGVLEAIEGWKQLNQDKLEQIKEDNAPLYDAISKALNLLAKKYGAEDIIIQKPIEVIKEVVPATEKRVLTDYQILKKIEILSLITGGWVTGKQIRDSFFDEIIYDKNEIVAIGRFEDDLGAKLADLADRDWLDHIGTEYQITSLGQKYIDDVELSKNLIEQESLSERISEIKPIESQEQKSKTPRPSPSESATLFPTGTVSFGNDGNQWRVTETKSGVKRWTKFEEMPIDEPMQIEGSSIVDTFELIEDEVDLDLLEQQLNDDSLEFDLNEDDLDNLEF